MTQYFANQRLSEKLEKLGIESQFDFWWVNMGVAKGDEEYPNPKNNWLKGREFKKAFHFSDLLLPQNAKKVFGDSDIDLCCKRGRGSVYAHHSKLLLIIIQENGDWQSFVEQEVDKRLSERV